jgi:LPXTG-motif cell wall-anchored protein
MPFIFHAISGENVGENVMRKIVAIGAIGVIAIAALALFLRKRNR